MNATRSSKISLLLAWAVLLLASALPVVILQEIFGQAVAPDQRLIISIAVILAAFLATLVRPSLRSLRPFLMIVFTLTGSQWLVYSRIDRLAGYPAWLSNPSFSVSMLAEQSLNLMVTLAMIAALLLLKKRPADFYLVPGDIAAPVKPVPWMGVRQGERWKSFGLTLNFFISLGTLAFLIIAGKPPLDLVIRALPFLPAILLAAALNAFSEEVAYKAAFLSVLENPVGARQVLYMVAAYFGIAHYYGVPYGVIGVLLAAFLGWILAKSMQETGGLFWAWFIHFWQDVWIFSFMAIGSITPGGG
jgi:hypothetical protein